MSRVKIERSRQDRVVHEVIESLEMRRLLSVVLNGTTGSDTFLMETSGSTTLVYLNQQLVDSTTTETNFTLNGLDGNDTFELSNVPANTHVVCNGGSGNDTFQTTVSSFTEIGSGATIDIAGGLDTDTMTFTDTADSSPPVYYIDNTGFGVFNGNKHIITVESDVESQNYTLSDHPDYLYVGSLAQSVHFDMGGGNDTVNFGGGDSIMPLSSYFGSFAGGSGTDDFILDDSAHVFGVPDDGSNPIAAVYPITPTSAFYQTLTSFEQLDIDAAKQTSDNPIANQIIITGNPGFTTVNLNGSSASKNAIVFGNLFTPVDFDALNIPINFNLPVTSLSITDQDADSSNNAWLIYTTTANGGTQVINKGSETLSLPRTFDGITQAPGSITISGGSTSDVFEVAGATTPVLNLYGGGGTDTLLFVNHGTNTNGSNLAALLSGVSLYYSGEYLDADDSGGTVGSGANSYSIYPVVDNPPFPPTHASIYKNSQHLLDFSDGVTTLTLDADNGNNNISFLNAFSTCQLNINGGGGNDTFTNVVPTSASLSTGPVNIIGAAGTDALVQNDTLNTAVDTYGIAGNSIWHDQNMTADTVTFDSTLESLRLNISGAGGTVTIASKAAALLVTVFGGAGNDHFYVGGGDLDSNGLANLTIGGGAGTDSLEFDDQSDSYSSSETEVYQLNSDELDKGTTKFPYSGFESLTLVASTNGSNVQTFGSTINVNTTDVPTTIYGAITRSAIINIGDGTIGDLSSIQSPVTLVMGGVGGARINDQNSTGDKTYTLISSALTVSSGQIIYYSGGGVTLNANAGNNTINVLSSASNALFTINGDDGNDKITLGGGNLAANLASVPLIDGGTGTNSFVLDDSSDPISRTGTISSSSFIYDRTYTYQTNIQSFNVLTGSGGSTIGVKSVPVTTTLTGGSGNDAFTIGTGILTNALTGNINATGGGGTNSILLDDHQLVNTEPYLFDSNGAFYDGASPSDSPAVTATGFGSYTLNCNNGSNPINVRSSVPVTIIGNGGDDKLNVTGDSSHTPSVIFDGGTGNNQAFVNTNNVGSSTVRFTNSQTLASLQIGTGGTVIAAPGSALVLNVKNLGTASSGQFKLDLNDNDLLYDYTGTSPLTTIQSLIGSARAGGAWTGNGITSTSAANNTKHNTTLGILEATEYESIYGTSATFDGLAIDTTALLIKYTYNGDADFNGKINSGDYHEIDTGYQIQHNAGFIDDWFNGDFDYNGVINSQDYALIDSAYQTQIAGMIAPSYTPPAAKAAPVRSSGNQQSGGPTSAKS